MAQFWPYYKELVAQLYEPLSPEDGFSDDEVTSAEQRLGLRLPRLLREFYLLAGRRADLNNEHNELVHPNDLQIEDENLVFYLENQAVSIWGVQVKVMGEEDPPVVQGDSVDGVAHRVWGQDFEHISSFLLSMLCWQGVMGGMAHGAALSGVDAQVEEMIKAHWQALDIGMNESGIRPYIGDGQVLCLAGVDANVELFVGARNEERLIEIEELLNVEWDYSSLDDD